MRTPLVTLPGPLWFRMGIAGALLAFIAWKSGLRVLLADDDLLTPTVLIAGCGVLTGTAAVVIRHRADRGLVVRRDSVDLCPRCQRPRPRARVDELDPESAGPRTPRCEVCGSPSPPARDQ